MSARAWAVLARFTRLFSGAFANATVCPVSVIAGYPHNSDNYTQGLTYNPLADSIIESTGLVGCSAISEIMLDGSIGRHAKMPDDVYGEGLAFHPGSEHTKIISLTWMDRKLCKWELKERKIYISEIIDYPFEGWGLTADDNHIIASDGTAAIRYFDPDSLQLIRTITVKNGGSELRYINDLEWIPRRIVNGFVHEAEILANVWHVSMIARIDPVSGRVKSWIDLAKIQEANRRDDLPVAMRDEAVANGIAFDRAGGRLFVTGKYWRKVYWVAFD